ncbi:MAG: FecR domain-containing protein, partial [Rhodobacteraceae bacterium]|nr:FecR domain-containing protein [Paracoccaceae bacterium]
MGIVSKSSVGSSALIIALTAPLPAFAVDAVGEIAAFAGSGTIDRGGQVIPFSQGAEIAADDLLATGPDGKVQVRFTDETELTLGPNADILIDEFVFANTDNDGAVFNLISGPARFVTGRLERARGKGIDVTTPVASIGIRGTDFFTEYSGDKLAVALFSGYKVDVTNTAGTTTLHPGEGTDTFGAGGPTPALSWQPDRINRALDLVTVLPDGRRPLPYL